MQNVFTREMSGFVKFFQIFSLFPLSSDAFRNIVIKFLMAAHLVGILIVMFYLNLAVSVHNDLDMRILVRIIVSANVNSLLLSQFINFVHAYLTRHKQLKIYQKLDEIDFLLQKQVQINVRNRKLRNRLKLKMFGILATSGLLNAAIIIGVTSMPSILRHYSFITMLPIFILRLRCVQCIFYVDIMRDKLNYVIAKLEDIVERSHKASQRKESRKSIYDELMVLKQIYGKVWDVSNMVNDCFGWSLLAIVEF